MSRRRATQGTAIQGSRGGGDRCGQVSILLGSGRFDRKVARFVPRSMTRPAGERERSRPAEESRLTLLVTRSPLEGGPFPELQAEAETWRGGSGGVGCGQFPRA